MKKKIRTISLMALALCASLANAKDIITSTPVTYMLAEQLMKGTSVETRYLPPKRYGIERLVNWFSDKGATTVKTAGQEATVAITLSAIWEQDPTYIYARQGNIRLIEIDASQALSPRAQGVATLTLGNGTRSKYAWLNPTNLIRMAGIVGDDLQKVYPQHAQVIERNQQRLMLNVRTLINQQQSIIFDKGIDSVVLMSEALEDFASGNQLFVVGRQFKPEFEWTEHDQRALKAQFEQDETLWLVTDKRPSKLLTSLIGAERILQIDAIDRWGSQGVDSEHPLSRWGL
ncbi:ABC transporter substrate-binding protein [Vibrio mytili]|uniref:ABC transporter substrate-binding protein n=1 Tax=Vibrio mytili TaxID=50718 RepID=UPI003C6EED58